MHPCSALEPRFRASVEHAARRRAFERRLLEFSQKQTEPGSGGYNGSRARPILGRRRCWRVESWSDRRLRITSRYSDQATAPALQHQPAEVELLLRRRAECRGGRRPRGSGTGMCPHQLAFCTGAAKQLRSPQSSSRRCRCRCRTACFMLWTPFSSPAPKGRGQEGRGGLEHPAARGCASPRHAACGICGTRSPVNRVIS